MKMSTYLVAFVVGPFEETPALDVDGVPLRVVTPIGKAHLTDLALEAGAFALRFFSSYFDIPYPGEKLDMVAIPTSPTGAMENLGCITYRETALSGRPGRRPRSAEMQRVAEVVAPRDRPHVVRRPRHHGVVGGDLAQRGLRHVHAGALHRRLPTRVADLGQLQSTLRDLALQIDGLHSTRPIEYEVVSPDRHARHVRPC